MRPERDEQQLRERCERTVSCAGAQQPCPADLPTGELPAGLAAGQLTMRGPGPYFPDAPVPWHESPDEIRSVAGPTAVVREHTFELCVASGGEFVDQLERHSAPIVLATRTLAERWPAARADLLEAVAAHGHDDGGTYRAQVPYWVTTIDVPA